jgi:ATP-dependent exoDNAse (exonuclease V) beta subunit
LSTVAFASKKSAIEKIAKVEGRLLAASAEEIAAAALAVERALAHALFERAGAAEVCRREAPILLDLPDGRLVEGVLDLAFREVEADGPVWTVVDFKTDVEMGERKDAYARQVALYAEAVSVATGERARGVLLSV